MKVSHSLLVRLLPSNVPEAAEGHPVTGKVIKVPTSLVDKNLVHHNEMDLKVGYSRGDVVVVPPTLKECALEKDLETAEAHI